MNDSPAVPDADRIPFGVFSPEIIESVPPKFFPTMVWGYFETEDSDGETGWIERTSDGASYSTILAQISGFLVETEAANTWVDSDDGSDEVADETAAPMDRTLSDLSGDVLVEEASAALSRLMVYPLPDGHEPTGRYVALICDDDPFESGNVELLNEDVSSELIEGLLRVAQTRFAETLSSSPFDDDVDGADAADGSEATAESETSTDSERTAPATEVTSVLSGDQTSPPITTFGQIFDGWAFLPLPEDVDVSAVWSLVLTTDSEDVIRWYTRRTPLLDENLLVGALSRMTFERELELIDSFDQDDDEPSRLMRETIPELHSLVPDDSPTGPLDPRIASLATRSLPSAETAIVASLLLFGTDALGSSSVVCVKELTTDTVALGDSEIDGFEELGLYRSVLRDILRNGLGEF